LIRLIAIDIDGTITFPNRTLDPVAIEAIRESEAAGIGVTLATGNVLAFAETAAILIGTSGPLIAEDGGIVFDQATGEERVLGNRIEVDRGISALERVFGPLKHTRSSARRLTGATLERGIPVGRIHEVIRSEDLDLVAVDSGYAIHLREPGVNKGNALREVSSMTRIPLMEIAAVGDGLNDVEMLQVAGVSFAVANSVEAVKKVSTHVTESAYGAGVAEAVKTILASRV
jgi:hypothetical protein